MVDYLPRSAWNARTAKSGPGDLTVSRVEGAVIHWPGTGSTKVIHTQAAVASALRGWQDYHMDGRGWSDIAYQVAVDQEGRAWTLRGLRTQSGANGDNDVNERYGAILLVLVTGELPSAAMKATVRAVIADFRRIYPKGTAIRPHSAVRPEPTDCPGDAARAAIIRGDFTPGSPQEDELSAAQVQQILNAIAASEQRTKEFVEARTQAYAAFGAKHTDQVLRTTSAQLLKAIAADDTPQIQAKAAALEASMAPQFEQLTSEQLAAVQPADLEPVQAELVAEES